jgi:hypothetical protein
MDYNKFQWAIAKELIPTLGLRVGSNPVWNFIDSDESAEAYCALSLNRVNAEARNISIGTIPKLGLMVNRPLYWRKRNYYASIVSVQHSISWQSSMETVVNMNQVRGWSGEYDNYGNPVHRHFGDGNRPFNLAELIKQTSLGSYTGDNNS